MCPHTTVINVSSSFCVCVLMLPYVHPHTAIYVSSYSYICVLILLCMCPHTTKYVSSYYYIRVSYMCVLILLYTRWKVVPSALCYYICVSSYCYILGEKWFHQPYATIYVYPHTAIYISLMLLYMCPYAILILLDTRWGFVSSIEV
jgi:hypothetical protein